MGNTSIWDAGFSGCTLRNLKTTDWTLSQSQGNDTWSTQDALCFNSAVNVVRLYKM